MGDEAAHVVIDAPPRRDERRIIAEILRLIDEVVRIDADAVTADESRTEAQRIPLRIHRIRHSRSVDVHAVKDESELVHKGDVDVALRVLRDLRRLRHANRRRTMQRLDDRAVNSGDRFKRLFVHARNDLDDVLQAMHLVAGIDALGRIADLELAAPHARFPFQYGAANVLRHARIHGRLVDDDAARLQMPADDARRLLQRFEIGRLIALDRRRHGDDDERRHAQTRRIRRKVDALRRAFFRGKLAHRIFARAAVRDLPLVTVIANDAEMPRKCHGERQPDIAQSHDGDLRPAIVQKLQHAFASFFPHCVLVQSS